MSWFRRRPSTAAAASVPLDTDRVLAGHISGYAHLSVDERALLRQHTETFMATKTWEAARGFELTDEMRAAISGQAALMALGLGIDIFRHVRALVVHPSTVVVRGTRPGPIPGTFTDEPAYLDGQAHDRQGPVILAWDTIRRQTRHGSIDNVVVHELAHKLDMADGETDGVPAMGDADAQQRWRAISAAELRLLQRSDEPSLLRDYAATNAVEFFAVACEVFFQRPTHLAEQKPVVYDVLAHFFRQDPARRPTIA